LLEKGKRKIHGPTERRGKGNKQQRREERTPVSVGPCMKKKPVNVKQKEKKVTRCICKEKGMEGLRPARTRQGKKKKLLGKGEGLLGSAKKIPRS